MNSPVTVDASVFVNAFSPAEEGSDKSFEFLARLNRQGTPIILPILVLPEIVAAVSRRQGHPELALQLAQDVRKFPNLTLVEVDESLANAAMEVAAQHRLRGSDAVYAALALRFGAELITLDREQLERLPSVLAVKAP